MGRALWVLALTAFAAFGPQLSGAKELLSDPISQAFSSARETAAQAALGLQGRPRRASAVLRVLTYNINGVPNLPKEKHERYREVGKILKRLREEGLAPQVVVVQEAFHPRTKELVSEAGYPHAQAGAPANGTFLGSGLNILSEYPIESFETLDYSRCAGWDCFANKGVLRARLKVPGLAHGLEVYTTHMNADPQDGTSSDEALKARLAQAAELAEFVRRTKSGSPAVIAGDFNFRPGEADYRLFSQLPGLKNAAEECSRSGACSGERDPEGVWRGAIDHQFYLSGEPSGSLLPVHLEQTFKEPVGGEPLSDHWGLEARYLLVW